MARFNSFLPVLALGPALAACGENETAGPGQVQSDDAWREWIVQSERGADPVVLSGEALGQLRGRSPERLIAFSFDGAWVQVPIQVDERASVRASQLLAYCRGSTVAEIPSYVYPGGLTGPDPDPNVDDDDEVVFLARDAGGRRAFGDPPGVVPGSGVEISISAPGDAEKVGYLYVFESAGTLEPGAEKTYGEYSFALSAGDYPLAFEFCAGAPNAEDSWFRSPHYTRHFRGLWASDVLTISADGASGEDILDLFNVADLVGGAACTHTALSFGVAFAVNKSGPVRSLRSYLGAASGTYTQRTHLFYEAREDIITDLRVHALLATLVDVIDHSEAASGMSYYDASNPGGLVVDGIRDEFVSQPLSPNTWQLLTGPQGSLAVVSRVDSNFDVVVKTLYRDEAPALEEPCIGDGAFYGASGIVMEGTFPCTDLGCDSFLRDTRILYYRGPEAPVELANQLADNLTRPLVVSSEPPAEGR